MADEDTTETGRCISCKRTFRYDPRTVETVLIDPQSGLPPGLTVLGTLRPATPEAVARSAEQPVCPDCLERARKFDQAWNPLGG
ncbi:hypothetical protein [Nonomuraea rhizosphaerae]|uniref:hypothetical protein n=1 Tax=Nonomuraea rhizosphaerae TaxID=2665663 RepID=UPI001C5E69B5|nr:hypothetical protein [Nonomuraea rhizosphaerae]